VIHNRRAVAFLLAVLFVPVLVSAQTRPAPRRPNQAQTTHAAAVRASADMKLVVDLDSGWQFREAAASQQAAHPSDDDEEAAPPAAPPQAAQQTTGTAAQQQMVPPHTPSAERPVPSASAQLAAAEQTASQRSALLQGANTAEWHPATVPGVIHTDLLAAKMIPDPFYRDNEAKLQWIGLTNWEYRTTFNASDELLRRQHIEVVFDGLDTYATVFLNDSQILVADNMFRTWRLDAKTRLKPGPNTLRVVFDSPVIKVLRELGQQPYYLPSSVQSTLLPRDAIKTDAYTRKAPYQYGWDWGPRFITMGVWRPVRLEAWNNAVLRDVWIRQEDVSKRAANVAARVEIEASAETPATLTIGYSRVGATAKQPTQTVERPVQLHIGLNVVETAITIPNPALWWPNEYGPQDRYDFKATLAMSGRAVDSDTVRTGLRKVVLRRDRDRWGRSFEFDINDVPIFAKGADVIPFDSFPPRVTEKQYRQIMQSARDAHMNMVRIWGGGHYQFKEFYDLCDELGILVWHDFMNGGAMVPGDTPYQENWKEEAIEQVRALRNHPSVVVWVGNNETEVGWFQWGDRIDFKNHLTPDQREKVWQDYLDLFKGILPTVVAEYDKPIPYWPSSPSSNFEHYPYSDAYGDAHYWDVWHGLKPFEEYNKQFPRFMSEYGFQSFPELRTVNTFTVPEDHDITSPVMMAHQKNTAGNQKIREYMLRDYNQPKDFASFLYVSQVLQAEGIKVGAEHLRRERPRIMGSIYWQLNDCWPVASWASIDYYGRWKALHYYARRFYNDLLVTPIDENGTTLVYVVSDRQKQTTAHLRARLMDFSGNVVWHQEQDINVAPLSSHVFWKLPTSEILGGRDPKQVVLVYELSADGDLVSRNTQWFDKPKNLELPTTQIRANLTQGTNGYKLQLSSPKYARDVYVTFGDLDTFVTDNYFDLLPNEQRTVTVTSSVPLTQLQQAMKVVSIVDAGGTAAQSSNP
jgi:beta-mannosidase